MSVLLQKSSDGKETDFHWGKSQVANFNIKRFFFWNLLTNGNDPNRNDSTRKSALFQTSVPVAGGHTADAAKLMENSAAGIAFCFFSLCSVVEGRDLDVHRTFIITNVNIIYIYIQYKYIYIFIYHLLCASLYNICIMYVSIHILQCILYIYNNIYIPILNLFTYCNVYIHLQYIELLNESHAIWRRDHFHDPGKPHGYIDCQKSGI